jgi:glycosyltransferase involved in cell wall biosynthesis
LLTHLLGGPTFSCTVHGPDEFDNPELLKLREKISHASFVVAVSSYGRSQLYRWADHRDWGKVQVVHCGVDEGFLGGAPVPPPEAPRLVCVGRLSAQKGHLLLLEAAARLAADGTRFEILLVGDGPLRAAVEEQVRRLGLQDRIRLGGWMDAGQVREAILAARAFVLPSFAEGLPVVLMEALALGRPVISTAIAGIPELVLPGVTGWLVPAGSVEALVPAMREALEASPARLAELGRAGAALVAEQHDARREARKLLELFRSATGESVCLRPAAAPRAPAALAEEAAGASPSAIK